MKKFIAVLFALLLVAGFSLVVTVPALAMNPFPTATTGSAGSITINSATLNGTVTTVPGGYAVTSVTFDYGLTAGYGTTIVATPSSVSAGAGATSVSGAITSLSPGTLYHFRVNAAYTGGTGGTVHGSDATFTTLIPTATTVAAGSITINGATLNGTVNDNGAAITSVTFDYGLTAGYGTTVGATPSTISAGAGSTPVSCALSSLSPGTLYHFRVNAAYTGGTAHGSDMTFTTLAPTATTGAAGSITFNGATLNGAVNDNGLAITSVTFDYGLTAGYGTTVGATPSSVAAGSGATSVSGATSTLSPGTLYHFRVNAVYAGGTTRGSDATFTTLAPTATTGSAGSITINGATLNGTVNDNGAAITSVTFDYGLTAGYGTTVGATPSSVSAGAGATSVSATIGSLSTDTLYHFRVNAVYAGGTTHGSDMTFTPRSPASSVYVNTAYTSGSAGGHIFGYNAFASIQAGINAVDAGGLVNVAAGTYNERITLIDGVRVRGDGASTTIIDGGGLGTVVTANSVSSATTLDGFTITQGVASQGGGMYNNGSSPVVTNCIFSFNGDPATSGGGMYNNASSPTVTNCNFSGNQAIWGGGVLNYNNSSPVLTNCIFSGNGDSSSQGGGMFNWNSCSPILTNCIFSGNTAAQDGGMLNEVNSSPVLTNCIFSGNSATNAGGIFNYFLCSPELTNCTFSGNSDTYGAGGMINQAASSPVVTNCIFWGDSGQEIIDETGSAPVVSYCDIQGGYSGAGNIDADPLFVSAATGDYHLTSASPCINAGSNAAVSGITTDIEGNLRIIGNRVDMGAYEAPLLHITGGFTADSKVYDGNNSATVLTHSLAGVNPGDDVSLTGGTATFNDKTVGYGKTVTLDGATLTGADAGNYILDSVVPTTGDITPLPITGSFTAADKVYDGTTSATVLSLSLSGTLKGDDVHLTDGTMTSNALFGLIKPLTALRGAFFNNETVGNNKTVTLYGAYLTGTDAGNYILDSVATTTANITAPSSDATLSLLKTSIGTLTPVFAAGTTGYTVSVANSVSAVTAKATVHQSNATVTVNKTPLTSGTYSGSIPLVVGDNTITVVVTAQDGATQITYTIIVNRAASSDATLSLLKTNIGTLSPVFASGTTGYTVSVANSVSAVTVKATVHQSNATIIVNVTPLTSGTYSGSIPLVVGDNTITVVVTAQDGATQITYTIIVNRAASSDATLSLLKTNIGTLSPVFASGTTGYTVSVANSVSAVTVKATVHQSNATIIVNVTPLTSGTYSGSIPLVVGDNTITVVVTAQDGATQITYTIIVNRAASSDATLSLLKTNIGTLSPVFASGTTGYTVSVANSVSAVTVKATVHQSNATIIVNVTPLTSGTYSGSIPLVVGDNTITVVVTAQDGATQITYTIIVNRAASSDATLSLLKTNIGTLSPVFASGTTGYTVSVANSVSAVTVKATVHQSNATIIVNVTPLTSGTYSGSIPLVVGDNTITVVVTAQDGATQITYTIIVTRAP